MSPLEIALIVIGIVIIIISCRLVDKAPDRATQTAGRSVSLEDCFTEEDRKQMKDKLNELLSGVSEEIIVRTDDSLSKLSNEKIMAVNDFSEQILEKINQNHEEVIFLYNMLNDKEKDLKSAVREIDSSKKKVQDIMEIKARGDNQQAVKNTKAPAVKNTDPKTPKNEAETKTSDNLKKPSNDKSELNIAGSNNNTQILTLYSKGKSIMEISKLLGLGQGEVKLVIDLFKGKK